jgi:hypothetical protein
MPATAAIDNETLDHLLSVVDDGNDLARRRRKSKTAPECGSFEPNDGQAHVAAV